MKKTLCMLLVSVMLLALAACGGGGEATAPPAAPSASSKPANTPETPETKEAPAELRALIFTFGASEDFGRVNDLVNEITLEKANVIVTDWVTTNSSSYFEQTNLMIAGQDEIHLFWSGIAEGIFDYAGQVSRGHLTKLNDLVDEYGPNIKSVLGDYLTCSATKDGEIYGVTTRRDLARSNGFMVRKDYLEKYDVSIDSLNNEAAIDDFFATLKADEPDKVLTLTNSLFYSPMDGWDNLSGNDYIGLDNMYDSSEVVILPESEGYAAATRQSYDWYQKGYTLTDIAVNTLTSYELFKAGNLLTTFITLKPGEEMQTYVRSGVEVEAVPLQKWHANTYSSALFLWAIPYYCEEDMAVAAVKYLNIMFDDEEMINLLCWGIEGEHYVIKDDGQLTYPDGVDAASSGYNISVNWMWGDQFKSRLWEGSDPEQWKQQDDVNKNSNFSVAFGFIFDYENVKTEYALVVSVMNEYANAMKFGVEDPDVVLPQFIEKMKNAGAEKIRDEKQAQLNAYLA